MESSTTSQINAIINQPYKYGFSTNIDSELFPKGLNEKIISLISDKKNDPDYLRVFRLSSYNKWIKMPEPLWAKLKYDTIDYSSMLYYSSPKFKKQIKSIEDVDVELLDTFNKLGISLSEQKRLANVAVDAVFDSISIGTTFKKELAGAGVIFCSISEAIVKYPNLVQKYLGSVVPAGDNYFTALNSAVFSDGSFCYIPPNTHCPLELSTYLYSTVQNWYSGDSKGRGGIYNFVTKRGLCLGTSSKILWTQVETGSAITWKYPSCVLVGSGSIGEFASVALTNNYQQADTGSKMIHIGNYTKSKIVSKGISAGCSVNNYRGLVKVGPRAYRAKNYSQCDSLLIGKKCQANTFPYIQVQNSSAKVEHEASTSKIGEDQIFYFLQRGISIENAISIMISGFCKDVFNELPMEFAMEADRLLNLKLEGTVG